MEKPNLYPANTDAEMHPDYIHPLSLPNDFDFIYDTDLSQLIRNPDHKFLHGLSMDIDASIIYHGLVYSQSKFEAMGGSSQIHINDMISGRVSEPLIEGVSTKDIEVAKRFIARYNKIEYNSPDNDSHTSISVMQ